MREDHFIRPAELGLRRLLWAFALLALALLGALAVVPVRSYFTEWRAQQQRFNQLAARAGLSPVEVSIKQIFKPALGAVDRCPSCHLGMGAGQPISQEKLFAAHPPLPHQPRELGCTICHGGQARATRADAAHGKVAFWNEPILDPPYVQAGCGSCHSHLRVGKESQVERGRDLFGRRGCPSCHPVGGAEKARAPDLAYVGLRGFSPSWQSRHLEQSAAAATADAGTRDSAQGTSPLDRARGERPFTPLPPEESSAVEAYLGTLVGAPRLMAAKALAHRLGCRGCHPIHGIGGQDGPDLSDSGRKPVGELDYSGVRGPHTLASWQREHLLEPGRVVPGSLMPNLDLTEDQAELLTLYVLSLRQRVIPEAQVPRDRVRALHLGERDFPTDGESLFGVLCAACHGPRGEGRQFGAFEARFPAIGDPEFLALADDSFLRQTVFRGRPARRMPAWGEKTGGLRPAEIDNLVAHLRSLEPLALPFEEVSKQPVELEAGRALYARDCAPCHGQRGEGSVLAPPHAAADNALTQDERQIHQRLTEGKPGTAMGRFRGYGPAALRGLIAQVRSLPRLDQVRRAGWAPGKGDASRGKELFAKACSGCHGERGEGKVGPAIGTPDFLLLATDGYIAATIVRGRGAAMPSFGQPRVGLPMLAPQEVADLVAFLRSRALPGQAAASAGARR